MAVGQIELNGMITRQHDLQNLKTSEDLKPVLDNMNNSAQVEKNVLANTSQVHSKDDAKTGEDREERNSDYYGDGGKNRKKRKDGTIVIKSARSFDVKI